MSEQVIGVCSNCGGDVVQHVGPWLVVNPPQAHCIRCNAARARGPVIQMGPPRELPLVAPLPEARDD
jgi:hypothetical protein